MPGNGRKDDLKVYESKGQLMHKKQEEHVKNKYKRWERFRKKKKKKSHD